ncbi:(Fe-S)-binding protein [Tolumonas osonensis]|uniref:Fe-S oxidoreductase n=1 Tax=Tolumonas osonensis TaxID=675874 RepID=A0A841GJ37_9GAMM|nr:(Fe-S)-binding protein [Tolumonas osonensis]MBB6054522.1 Fe-S oxidoreductase [Tolumonas osonensis]
MRTELDWSDYQDRGMGDAYADIPRAGGDFAKAVAVCIRSGVCEQHGRGVMCPSFRITEKPLLSPGGRVQLLKRALNSDAEALTSDRELAEAMDLCVACKGCKRECENNVDMAQIKIEYLAQQLKNQPLLWRSRLFAYSPLWLNRYAWLGKLIHWRNRSPLLAQWGERLLGIAAKVPLPEVALHPFAPAECSFAPLVAHPSGEARTVVLWLDSFSTLFAPQQAEDALHLLRLAGFTVHVIHPLSVKGEVLDSGRSLLTFGLVNETRSLAKQLLTVLSPYVEQGLAVVGLEPSSLLMLRDEYKTLGLGQPAVTLAKQAMLLEEFIAAELTRGGFRVPFQAGKITQPVLIHGHCHQKAIGAMKSVRRVLKTVPGLEFSFIESSCCGMAGTFGLEAEHVDYSHQMAQQSLVPALQAAPDALVVCNGFGCAHQIKVTAGRHPLHLATLLRQALAQEPE